MSDVAVVTGAARGIGLESCRQLLARGFTVVACPRTSGADELDNLMNQDIGPLFVIPMDVGDDATVAAAVTEIGRVVDHVDLLINNAGTYPKDDGGVERLDLAKLHEAFNVNAVGALRVTRAMLPLLRKGSGRRVIQMTSLMGSMGDNTSGGSYAYRMSKAAMNMANRNLAHELDGEGFICLAVHPGWVRTRMGGAAAPLELGPAVEQILENALDSGRDDSGGFKGPGRVDLPF
jgi:NAD(P)-dependent dehydrogenase (short-subunit alcohol dehydrogenase family)